jgi:hypothetical protein
MYQAVDNNVGRCFGSPSPWIACPSSIYNEVHSVLRHIIFQKHVREVFADEAEKPVNLAIYLILTSFRVLMPSYSACFPSVDKAISDCSKGPFTSRCFHDPQCKMYSHRYCLEGARVRLERSCVVWTSPFHFNSHPTDMTKCRLGHIDIGLQSPVIVGMFWLLSV